MNFNQVVSDYKDTNFWKQFTTERRDCRQYHLLFQTTKIQTFESNSQLGEVWMTVAECCFRLQRYKLLKAIHNKNNRFMNFNQVVSDYKDTNFWKQFTTERRDCRQYHLLFQTTKIQTFESNSQLGEVWMTVAECCFRLQRYKILKAIHNILPDETRAQRVVSDYKDTNFWKQFTTLCVPYTKISGCFRLQRYKLSQSNSQQTYRITLTPYSCFRLQRYKLLKAIHNTGLKDKNGIEVVSDYKDTNFWKQFTTRRYVRRTSTSLFQTTKIQIFESNSQRYGGVEQKCPRCFRLQRYKFLKAIHNRHRQADTAMQVVSDYKDTNFWKQFTTTDGQTGNRKALFQTTKIQTFSKQFTTW